MRLRPFAILVAVALGIVAHESFSPASASSTSASAPRRQAANGAGALPVEVYFSPKGGCTEAVVRELGRARNTVLVQAYSFTSAPIAKALVDASRRGVKVQVILDASQRTEKYTAADFLRNAGIPTAIDAKHAIAHNKVMVIDGATLITGSFNFTTAAEEHNAENLLVLRDAGLAQKYADNWAAHATHSEPFTGHTDKKSQTGSPRQTSRK